MFGRNQSKGSPTPARRRCAGFSLIELMVTTIILVSVSGVVVKGVQQMSLTQNRLQTRTEMHSSVRSATELMQQEIGQAGRATLVASTSYTLSSAVTAIGAASPTVSSTSGMFVGEQIIVDTGANEETVTLTALVASPASITAVFSNTHASGVPIRVAGAFANGVIPTTATNGSTGNILKIYGDVNDDGNMVYVEYTCDTSNGANGGNLYRNAMLVTAVSKPALSASMVLLPNIYKDGSACFTYQQKTIGADTYVVDVAITLTVQTPSQDLQTGSYQTETKALLNVSPRNVFQVWQMVSAGVTNRLQPMPASPFNVASLLP